MRPNLKQARLQKNMSQQELAELVGISRPAISRIESGRMDARRVTWRKLAKILKSTIEHLSLDDANQ